MFVDAVRLADVDVDQAEGSEGGSNSARVEGAGAQPRPGGNVGAGGVVHVGVGDDIGDSERGRPGLGTRATSRDRRRALSPERLIAQLEMTTSTVFGGERDLLDVALAELDVGGPRRRAAFSRASSSVSSVMSSPIGPAGRADAAARRAGRRRRRLSRGRERFAFVQVGNRGRDSAAERRPRASGSRHRRALAIVEFDAEALIGVGMPASTTRRVTRRSSRRLPARRACRRGGVGLRFAYGLAESMGGIELCFLIKTVPMESGGTPSDYIDVRQ